MKRSNRIGVGPRQLIEFRRQLIGFCPDLGLKGVFLAQK